jgi:hypothetical protein
MTRKEAFRTLRDHYGTDFRISYSLWPCWDCGRPRQEWRVSTGRISSETTFTGPTLAAAIVQAAAQQESETPVESVA